MITAGQKAQALRRLVEQFRLGQNAPSDGDHGIGGDKVGARMARGHLASLGFGKTQGRAARRLALQLGLVDLRRLPNLHRKTRPKLEHATRELQP